MKQIFKILGIVLLVLLMPFAVVFAYLFFEYDIFSYTSIFIVGFIGLIVLFDELWIIFTKTKGEFWVNAYIAMKKALEILGITFLALLMPFVMEVIYVLFESFAPYEIFSYTSIFIVSFMNLIVLFVVLWIIFIKTKEKYLADTYIAGICLIAVFIGLFFFAFNTGFRAPFASYDKIINSPDCCL